MTAFWEMLCVFGRTVLAVWLDAGVKKGIEIITARTTHVALSAGVLRSFSGSRPRRYSVDKKHWTV